MKFEMIIGIAFVLFHAIHTATSSLIDSLIAQFAFEKTMNQKNGKKSALQILKPNIAEKKNLCMEIRLAQPVKDWLHVY